MSKKIIYLLSLLMVLSLVFASCKKNNPLNGISGTVESPDKVSPEDGDLDPTTGLFTDKENLGKYDGKIVQSSEVARFKNNDYYRNPVMTVIGDSTVFIAYEIRQQSEGSGNDVALTGTNNVDIAYIVSTKSGVDWDTGSANEKIIDEAQNINESHGAPIVYNTGDYIIIVASAGIGLSVGTYDSYNPPKDQTDKSWLEYSYAKITKGSDGKPSTLGDFSEWQKLTHITMAGINAKKGTGITQDFKQYGTHTSRGVVVTDTSKKLLLPVTVAEFKKDSSGNWGDSRWGYIVYELTLSGGTISQAEAVGNIVAMNLEDKTKTTRIAAGTSKSDFTTLTVSDNSSKLVLYKGTQAGGTVSETGIKGADGSPGILVVNKWAGRTAYNPANYPTGVSSANKKSLISHVTELQDYYTKKLAIRAVEDNFSADVAGSHYYVEGYQDAAKSSSIDILKDGTIVMVAEGGTTDGAQSKKFRIHFSRYTQAYLASQMGN